ncbi:MAG TPA: hypothetical protein VKZ18_18920 [Polyangia bacterium]|nr:hypothetical protein [Polyangia bacterium]
MSQPCRRTGPLLLTLALALAPWAGCGGGTSTPPVFDGGGHDGPKPQKDASDVDVVRHDAGPKDGGARDASDGGIPDDCTTGAAGEPTELRCTGLYSDWATKTVASNARQYDPGLHLWSDGAGKTRWISLPAGATIDTSDMDQWTFPNGTKVWKEFTLGGKRIETRLIWKRPTGAWYLTTYRWSADGQTSTTELTAGETNVGGGSYEIPTQSNCYDCHAGRYDMLLGFEAVALSSPQASGFTMADLTANHLLTAPPAAPLTIPGDAKTAAALGYLHINCGTSCHNRESGEAGSSGFYTRLDVATLTSPQATDTWTTGVGVNASFYPPGVAQPQIFVPCDTGSSAAYYRMSHRDGAGDAGTGTQMPPIITHQVDSDGVAAIAAWLNGFPQCGAHDGGRD